MKNPQLIAEGARALGLDHAVGSLEKGKRADMIVLDTAPPHMLPMYHPISHLVYAVRGADVKHVWVDGEMVVKDRRLMTLDMDAIRTEVAAMGRLIAARS